MSSTINNEFMSINEIIENLGLSRFFANKITQIINYKNVLIVDDSGSMNCKSDNTVIMDGPYDNKTRWDEAKYFTKNFINLTSSITKRSVDVWFLNREACLGINGFSQIEPHFNKQPNGFTPLKHLIENIIKYYKNEELPLNINIITDGMPTNLQGHDDRTNFVKTLDNFLKTSKSCLTISACTDDSNVMSFLDYLDKKIPRTNVVDDYENEKRQILRVQGNNFNFNYQDYICCCLIGALDPEIDNLDEFNNKPCCVIV
jgi:hypothetical protein